MKTISRNILGSRNIIALGTIPLATMLIGAASGQGIIVSQTGQLDENAFFASRAGYVYSVSWTSANSYSGADVSIALSGDPGGTGVAYLTTQIGTGTSLVQQVATASFDFPSTDSYVTVLSGLNLLAGTYYLTIQPAIYLEASWLGSSSLTFSAAPGVTANGEYQAIYSIPQGNGPAYSFSSFSQSLDYVVGLTPVPEPSIKWLILLGCGTLVLWRRRSKPIMHI